MSENGDTNSHAGFDASDHQAAYIYSPSTIDDAPARPTKRRKVSQGHASTSKKLSTTTDFKFESLFGGLETSECVQSRQELFNESWSKTETQIQSILDEANEGTLEQVTKFVAGAKPIEDQERIATGFIATGPNISSQELLFSQLAVHLKNEINGPVVILRSADALNLKAVLKQIIRDATSQKSGMDDDEEISLLQDGRKLLNYDLEILHGFVRAHGSQAVAIAFQDSEAFDNLIVAELVVLFSSWLNRIPFVLLFGIATSLDLFHERLPRKASRCLFGKQFDVEQTSVLLERIFSRAVAGRNAPLRLGTILVSSLLERQNDHLQSVQSFIAAVKYAYMSHFYGNVLSIINVPNDLKKVADILKPQHFEAIRMLPSFRSLVERLIAERKLDQAKSLLEDNTSLLGEMGDAIASRDLAMTRTLRAMHLLATCSSDNVSQFDLYMSAIVGDLRECEVVRRLLDSIKRMTPVELMEFTQNLMTGVTNGNPDMDLHGWIEDDSEFVDQIQEIETDVLKLEKQSEGTGESIRSSYAIHSKGVRATVVAQKVQLSYETSKLSKLDKEFTSCVDRLSELVLEYFTLDNPQDLFLNEVWLYDSISPYRDVFTPRPRAAIERALSAPYDYLTGESCDSEGGLSSTHPATSILYQMYLETGSLINVYDLWSAFFEMVSGSDEQKLEERDALVLFYRALAELRSLGLIKQSKKKTDHLAKVAWKGL